MKEILVEEGIETVSPLSCFKEAFNIGLISKENEEIFSLMVKKRNEIVHIYSDEDAYEAYLLIKSTFTIAQVKSPGGLSTHPGPLGELELP
ncbi:MAG: hypothetical protein COV46_00240 [Deltaproteobacteria bacterium CG11_big_fil_rev_8_21_14_0_20_49_13]|nr:MAG: hypothetical protein COV46_00240 [Deltaproteobacteria bacterium CG11_big_fil_rev_8_21_14_0_20_49_13]